MTRNPLTSSWTLAGSEWAYVDERGRYAGRTDAASLTASARQDEGRHRNRQSREHCIDAQAMALRALADVLAGPR